MLREYIQSEEEYKGFKLVIRMTCLDDYRNRYHRSCEIYKNGECIGVGKTKKECKELIKEGYIK